MKIGILTLHSQLNYGAVLQAYALQEYLQESGHTVVILDRWFDNENSWVWKNYKNRFSARNIFKGFIGTGVFQFWKRIKRTRKFLSEKLKLSPFHFVTWDDVNPNEIDLDLMIVGSDQVWNPEGDLDVFLVNTPRIRVPLASYAASFGNFEFNNGQLDLLKSRLTSFAGISVREQKGKEFLEKLGIVSIQVADPVFLLTPEMWKERFPLKTEQHKRKLVCYFMENELDSYFPELIKFAEEKDCEVEILVNSYFMKMPKSLKELKNYIQTKMSMYRNKVQIKFNADPAAFLKSFQSACWILTDSFHGTAFSVIFHKDFAVLKPQDPWRCSMFGRIEETCASYCESQCIYQELKSALGSFSENQHLCWKTCSVEEKINTSSEWLHDICMRASYLNVNCNTEESHL